MIFLTFYHGRNIFRGHEFASWVKNFPSAKFEGFEYGHYMPTLSVSLKDFEAAKETIPTKNLVRIEGRFTLLQELVYGVKRFRNEISEKVENAIAEFEN